VRDDQYKIVLPTASTPAKSNAEASGDRAESAASGGKKKQQHKGQPKKAQPTKAEAIIAQNNKRILDKSVDEEAEKLRNVETKLKQIATDDYAEAIDLIDRSLHYFKTPTQRLEILKKKFDLQRKYLRSLKKKASLSSEERSKLELLQVGFFATLCEMTHLEDVVDAFTEKKKFMEELVDESPMNAEKWYRFQLEKINSRLPRRAQGEKDSRVADFIPDEWQVKFLNAVDNRQSIIIVAPTASGEFRRWS
jgi:superfamily II RNA helicase